MPSHASVEAEDVDLKIPLMLAAQHGHEEVFVDVWVWLYWSDAGCGAYM